MSLVVVGTGTEVGKTVVSALILARHGSSGNLSYRKPVATGGAEDRDTATVARLSGVPATSILNECYWFEPPVSPHLAARLAGATIDSATLLAELRRHHEAWPGPERGLLIEGVGGVLVPLDDDGLLLIDLLTRFGLPCLLVASAGLGTINHTLLTLEALRTRRIEVPGVVLVGPAHGENRRAIERFGQLPVLAEVPWISPLDRAGVAAASLAFDPEGRLAPLLFGAKGNP